MRQHLYDCGVTGGKRAFQGSSELFGLLYTLAVGTELFGELREVGVREGHSVRPSRKPKLLVHTNGPVHTVVQDNRDERRFVANSGLQLLDRHHETAVA